MCSLYIFFLTKLTNFISIDINYLQKIFAGRKKCDEKVVNRKKQKMLLFGAFVGCIIVALKVYSVMKPYNSIPLLICKSVLISSLSQSIVYH